MLKGKGFSTPFPLSPLPLIHANETVSLTNLGIQLRKHTIYSYLQVLNEPRKLRNLHKSSNLGFAL
ncbi:hypothetical protein FIS3754_33960 [Fischerella sp. NIES-3754]|nr:hypothetical protein FIS3754_33960 [Fischerella sp. NIES-3754]BCX09797.1 MAG: hypothetical protein KatS3mg066_3656 [Fischerella sp.]